MGPEKRLENSCVVHAKRHGWLAYKLKFIGVDGAPDRLFISKTGRFLFVEFKSWTGKLRASQQIVIDDLREHCSECLVCCEFQQFCKILEGLSSEIDGKTE